ncbi:hypothetical protein Tco_0630043 [Tanacetum coccineum]
MKAVKEKEQLQKTLDSWKDSSKNLWRLIDSGMSSNSKVGLGFDISINNEVYPNPLSGDYTPKPQEEIDDSLYVYGKKGPQKPEISDSGDNSSEHSSCQSNDNEGSSGNTSEHSFETESESISVQNEMSTSRLVITNEKVVSELQEVEPSCAKHVKTPRQPLKDKETHKVNRKNWNDMMERELGEGYSFTKKKCFVCGSLSHLIKDCDYYEKKMAREAEVKRVVNTGNWMEKPVWTKANRVNHSNKFVPRSVQLNAGRPNFNSVRPNINTGRTNINSVRPKVNAVSSNINTVRSRQPVPNKTSNSLNPKRPQMNQINQRRDFSKSHSSVRRFVMGIWGSAVKTSASYNWRNSRPNFNYNSGPTFIRTVNAKGPQGRPKPVKAWVTRINWRILKNSIGDLLPLEVAKATCLLVKKVKKLEGFLKRRNVVLSDSEEEETEAQGRKSQSQDDPLVSLVHGLITPSKTTVNASGEEQVEDISPNTLEAAKTLSRVASLKPKSIDKGRRYKRRKETKGKKVVSSLDFQEEVDTGAKGVNTAEGVNTGSIKISTVSEQVSTVSTKRSIPSPDKGQRAGKAPMIIEETPKKSKEQILQEEASLAEAIRLDTLQKEEVAKQVHLDSLLAQRIEEEEELNKQQKKRRAQVQFEAQHYTDEDWDLIRAKIEANAELSKKSRDMEVILLKEFEFEEVRKNLIASETDMGLDGPEIAREGILESTLFELGVNGYIYMLIERKYPLSAEICKTMLNKKLQGGKPDEDCYKMLKMMEKQAGIRK